MSVEAISWAFAQPIPPAPKVVLLALANNADRRSGLAFPGVESLVENCAPMKKRTIQNHLHWLANEAKLITVTPRHTESGRQTSNLYTLHLTATYCGEGVESCTLPLRGDEAGEDAATCIERMQESAPRRMQQLLHGEGAKASTPSDKNLDPVSEPSEGIAGGEATSLRRLARSASTWEGYRRGYHKRFGIDPVRDARVNVDLCKLVDRLGAQEAPAVAEFYLSLEKPLYVQAGHPTSLLLRDYQSLRTQWKTGVAQVPKVGQKAYQPILKIEKSPEECPPGAAEALSRILGRDAFSFSGDRKGTA